MAPQEAIFRSAEMSLVQLYISNEIARDVLSSIGELGNVQFRDLNSKVSIFQRTFVAETRKLDNSLRQLRLLRDQMDRHSVPVKPLWEGQMRLTSDEVASLESLLDQLEETVTSLHKSEESLESQRTELLEQRHTLRVVHNFFGQLDGSESSDEGAVSVVAGIIATQNAAPLERLLWRSLRGNLVYQASSIGELYDAKAKKPVEKSVLIAVTHGQEYGQKAHKIAEALDAKLFKAELSAKQRSDDLNQIKTQISDVEKVLNSTKQALEAELEVAAARIASWEKSLAEEKAVYETLNLLQYDQNRKLLIGEGWVPTDDIPEVQRVLKRISEDSHVESPAVLNLLETNRTPPTFHRTNKITGAFQAMIDVYAVATYQEVNPALPTVITFPFMFAVMFGDLGHGFILTLVALSLVLNERKLAKANYGDIFDMAFGGRYILLFMGLFSIYTGGLYNDLFSKSMTLFESGWEFPDHKVGETVSGIYKGSPYVFGLDWAWHGTDNNLLFTNSYKMKLSVLMGYVHMSYSYMFSLVNALHFKSPIDVWGNFVPGLIFFQGIFGYLSLAIVYKWTIDWVKEEREAPSLLNMLINMFLSPGTIDAPLYKGQAPVQLFLLVAALISVPWLLLLKPMYLKRKLEQEAAHHDAEASASSGEAQAESHNDDDDDDEEHEEHTFGDILIHQVIHTIEFCLNCVSHTASYLRLWALSLAHAQLSQVLWTMTLQNAFGLTGIAGMLMTVVLFAMWFTLTVAVLVCMEGTSAMLHALRLHWVESMSKFYIGEGKAFEPFTFELKQA